MSIVREKTKQSSDLSDFISRSYTNVFLSNLLKTLPLLNPHSNIQRTWSAPLHLHVGGPVYQRWGSYV